MRSILINQSDLNGENTYHKVLTPLPDNSVRLENQLEKSMDIQYERGCAKVKEIIGEDALKALIENHKVCAPQLSKYVIENVWGDLFSREGSLSRQQLEMLTVAIIGAIGDCSGPLKVHMNGALNVGVTPEQISDILTLIAALACVPRALSAAATAREFFQDLQLS